MQSFNGSFDKLNKLNGHFVSKIGNIKDFQGWSVLLVIACVQLLVVLQLKLVIPGDP